MSQHLTMMYRAGLVARRKQGAQVYYRIANESVVSVCKIVCAQVALNSDKRHALPVL
jgi:ArsR family transcriptional regulator